MPEPFLPSPARTAGRVIVWALLAAVVLGWLFLGRRRSPRPPQPPHQAQQPVPFEITQVSQ